MERNFCRYCGSKMEKHLINKYNEETGEQLTALHCTNLKCEIGCGQAGHIWGKWWKLERTTCQRCGCEISYYY